MNKPFSMSQFKNWLGEQDLANFFSIQKTDETDEFVGKPVKSKVCATTLAERIETEDDLDDVVADFLQTGGTILATEDKRVQIEVASGSFYLPRFCVKIAQDR